MATTNTTATKTIQTAAIVWQTVANGAKAVSSTLNVVSAISGTAFISIGRRTATAFTAGWPNIRIEASKKDSPDNSSWIPIYTYQPGIGASIANATLNGAVSAAAVNFVVNASTNITVGDLVFLSDAANANFEIARVLSVSVQTVTTEQTVVNAHSNAAVVTDQAEVAAPPLPLLDYKNIRVFVDNANSGQEIAVEVIIETVDNLTTT